MSYFHGQSINRRIYYGIEVKSVSRSPILMRILTQIIMIHAQAVHLKSHEVNDLNTSNSRSGSSNSSSNSSSSSSEEIEKKIGRY